MPAPRSTYRVAWKARSASKPSPLAGRRASHGAHGPDRQEVVGPRPKKLKPVPSREDLARLVTEIEAERRDAVPILRSRIGRRSKAPGRVICPACETTPMGRLRGDGSLPRHRIRVDDPTAPWCPGSPTDRTD